MGINYVMLLGGAQDYNRACPSCTIAPYDQCTTQWSAAALAAAEEEGDTTYEEIIKEKMDSASSTDWSALVESTAKDAKEAASELTQEELKAKYEELAKETLADGQEAWENLSEVDQQKLLDDAKAEWEKRVAEGVDLNKAGETISKAFEGLFAKPKSGEDPGNYDDTYTTGWTMIYTFNTFFYGILAIEALLAVLGGFVLMCRKAVACLHCCCCSWVVHFVMVLMSLIYRFNSEGDVCANRTQGEYLPDRSFKDDAQTLYLLSVTGLILYSVYTCLMCCAPCSRPQKS